MNNSVIFTIPILTGRGAARVVSCLSRHLDRQIYIVPFSKGSAYSYIGKLKSLEAPATSRLFLKPVRFYQRILRLRYIKRKLKPVATISMLLVPNLINILSGGPGKRILSVRSLMLNEFLEDARFPVVYRLLVKLTFKHAEQIVCVSTGIKYDIVKRFGIDNNIVKVIYNPYSSDYITMLANQALPVEYTFLKDVPVILTIGTLSTIKCHAGLIKAYAIAKQKVKNLKLFIIGEGVLKSSLIDLSLNLGLRVYSSDDKYNKNNLKNFDIFFTGFLKNPFLILKYTDVYALSSYSEGFPNAMVEAMICKCAIIAADCKYGPREILTGGKSFKPRKKCEFSRFGILLPTFEKGTEEKKETISNIERMWGEVIIKIFSNTNILKQYQKAAAYRAKDFEADVISKKWEELID